MPRLSLRTVTVVGLVTITSCGDHSGAEPRVSDIDDALAAVETELGGPQQYFELSADLSQVTLFVESAGGATPYVYADRALLPGDTVAGATGATFTARAVAFEEDRIFDRIRAELDDPAIIDFAVQGGPAGAVVYDATVASKAGGVLLVLLAADGEILGVQGE